MARPRSQFPPQTAAERQQKCRAIKRGEWREIPGIRMDYPPGTMDPNVGRLLMEKQAAALPAPASAQPALPAPEKTKPALPAPPTTAIQKVDSTSIRALALPDESVEGDALRLSLPSGVATRLRSLLARQDAGKTLTVAEHAEAQGLLDIAEYFVVQRMRHRLAA